MPTLTCIFYLMCLGVVYLFRTFYRGWAIPYLLLAMAAAPVLICLLSLPAMLKMELRMEGKRVRSFTPRIPAVKSVSGLPGLNVGIC